MLKLKLENIYAGYGSKEVLKRVSLDVSAGEIVALLGPNGAGKSTVLKVIAGLLAPTSGMVIYRDQNITQMPTYRRAHNGIGYVMQNDPVFESLTVAEHYRLAVSYELQTASPDAAKRCGVLSGGERQRLAIDVCQCRKPQLLLLDEPSAGLAPDTAATIYARLKEQITETGTAVVVVEQNLWFLPNFAQRIVVMRNGEIYRNDLPLADLYCSEAIFKTFYGDPEPDDQGGGCFT